MSLKLGDEILEGKYRVLDILGEGAFCKVYLAEDVPLKRRVAIKELRREDWTEEEYVGFRRRFQREAQIGAALRHENVVQVHTLEPSGEDFYLVMEYVDGPGLQAHLQQQGPLPVEEAVEIAIQLCDGLAAVHDHPLGIVHRDIKPSNILLTSQGQPKITDFGLAQLHGESLRSLGKGAKHPGTPAYMSPEQETSGGYLRPASDIYSLGCILFEMLAGRAYKRAGVEGSQPSHWRPDVLSWLDAVLAKMMASQWRSRFQLAGEARSELRAGLEADLRTLQELDSLLESAGTAFSAGEWDTAIKDCTEALQLKPGDVRFETLLKQARTQKKVESLLEGLYPEFAAEEWPAVETIAAQILALDPNHEVAAEMLAQAKEQSRLENLYEQALAAEEDRDWPSAQRYLEWIIEADDRYLDAADRLDRAKQAQNLAGLFEDVQSLMRDRQWDEAILKAQELQDFDAHYPGLDKLLKLAQRELKSTQLEERKAQLANLYREAERHLEAKSWSEASAVLKRILELDPMASVAKKLLLTADLGLAEDKLAMGELEPAMQTLFKAMQDDPEYGDPRIAAQSWDEFPFKWNAYRLFADAFAQRRDHVQAAKLYHAGYPSVASPDADKKARSLYLAGMEEVLHKLDSVDLDTLAPGDREAVAEFHLAAGELRCKRGHGQKAQPYFNVYVNMSSSKARAHYRVGRLYEEANDSKRALRHYRHAKRAADAQPELIKEASSRIRVLSQRPAAKPVGTGKGTGRVRARPLPKKTAQGGLGAAETRGCGTLATVFAQGIGAFLCLIACAVLGRGLYTLLQRPETAIPPTPTATRTFQPTSTLSPVAVTEATLVSGTRAAIGTGTATPTSRSTLTPTPTPTRTQAPSPTPQPTHTPISSPTAIEVAVTPTVFPAPATPTTGPALQTECPPDLACVDLTNHRGGELIFTLTRDDFSQETSVGAGSSERVLIPPGEFAVSVSEHPWGLNTSIAVEGGIIYEFTCSTRCAPWACDYWVSIACTLTTSG